MTGSMLTAIRAWLSRLALRAVVAETIEEFNRKQAEDAAKE